MEQNTNGTKYECTNDKIQTQQNTKEQKKNCQNTNVTKYKCFKIQIKQIQIEQNAKIPKYKQAKIQEDKIQTAKMQMY